MLVDDLGLAISRKQNAETIEGGYVALKLDPVLEEHGYRDFMVLKMSEKHILNRLGSLYCHVEFLFTVLVTGASL